MLSFNFNKKKEMRLSRDMLINNQTYCTYLVKFERKKGGLKWLLQEILRIFQK